MVCFIFFTGRELAKSPFFRCDDHESLKSAFRWGFGYFIAYFVPEFNSADFDFAKESHPKNY